MVNHFEKMAIRFHDKVKLLFFGSAIKKIKILIQRNSIRFISPILTVIISKTKYFCLPFSSDWRAICAALLITGPKRVGPARETLKRALV